MPEAAIVCKSRRCVKIMKTQKALKISAFGFCSLPVNSQKDYLFIGPSVAL